MFARLGSPSSRRAGFSLTEIAIVLGIMGSILSVIWVAANGVNNSKKVRQATTEALDLIAGYRTLYAANGIDVTGAWADVTCTGVNSGFFPSDTNNSAGACVQLSSGTTHGPINPWGGAMGVQVNQATNTFIVYFNSLPQSACVSLAMALYQNNEMIYQEMNNGVSWVTAQYMPPAGTATAWTPAQISANCGNNNLNVVQVGVAPR